MKMDTRVFPDLEALSRGRSRRVAANSARCRRTARTLCDFFVWRPYARKALRSMGASRSQQFQNSLGAGAPVLGRRTLRPAVRPIEQLPHGPGDPHFPRADSQGQCPSHANRFANARKGSRGLRIGIAKLFWGGAAGFRSATARPWRRGAHRVAISGISGVGRKASLGRAGRSSGKANPPTHVDTASTE